MENNEMILHREKYWCCCCSWNLDSMLLS